jgi:hypothetical protein
MVGLGDGVTDDDGVGVGDGPAVGNAAGGRVAPGGRRFSDTSSHAMPLWMHSLTRYDIAAGSQAFRKSPCSVNGEFIDASVTVPVVDPAG